MNSRIIGPINTSNGQTASFVPLPASDKRTMYAVYRFHNDPSEQMTLMWEESRYAYPVTKEKGCWVSRHPFKKHEMERFEKGSAEFDALEELLAGERIQKDLLN